MLGKREEIVEFIEVAIVELRGVAQPRDIAELRELEMDARETESPEQLQRILEQATNLREFCEQRKRSSGDAKSILLQPPPRGRRAT